MSVINKGLINKFLVISFCTTISGCAYMPMISMVSPDIKMPEHVPTRTLYVKEYLCGDNIEQSNDKCVTAEVYNEKKKDAHCKTNIFGELHCPIEVPATQFERLKEENAQQFIVRWIYVEKKPGEIQHIVTNSTYDIEDPNNVELYKKLKKQKQCKFFSAKGIECNMRPIVIEDNNN